MMPFGSTQARLTLAKTLLAAGLLPGTVGLALAQSVQPLLMEYGARAEGKFALTNNTAEPMVVTIEPRSFSIESDGRGIFRKLDPAIHLEMSTMSVRLLPQQSYTVYYKAWADAVPAWFSIYSTFTPLQRGSSLEVRIQLPHTVYLYQTKRLEADSISVETLTYDGARKKIICDLKNAGSALGRVQEIRPVGKHNGAEALAGFPLLPGAVRHFEMDWHEKDSPQGLEIQFPHFTLKPVIKYPVIAELAAPTEQRIP